MEEPLLIARDLRTWFELRRFGIWSSGLVRAVDGVDFEIRRGEAAAFVGESGCGKSSLARTLLGLCRPTAGRIIFDGRDRADRGRGKRADFHARVGYIQQDPYGALPPFMSVGRILAEPLVINRSGNRASRGKRIRAVLEEVNLSPPEEFLPKFPHILSGGQQQRLVIARALILEPLMLVADEPVSMLDASVRVEILETLSEIRRSRGLSLIFITHDLSSVRHYADRIFVMYAGRIVETAAAGRLLPFARHPYTRALMAALPEPDPENAHRFRNIPGGEPPSLAAPPPGCRFHPRCPEAIPGLCAEREPPLVELSETHRCACWLAEKRDGKRAEAGNGPEAGVAGKISGITLR